MKVALAQINTTVGDLEGNARRIREATQRARGLGADLVVFPELAVSGYAPRDLLDAPAFVDAVRRTVETLAAPAEWNQSIGVVVGFPEAHPGPGQGLFNACAFIDDGRLRAVGRKGLIPGYEVFDERRYFDGFPEVTVVPFRGRRIGLSICEDVWNDAQFHRRRRYARDPVAELVAAGADLVLNPSASPFHGGKPGYRARMMSHSAARHGVPLVFVNMVGGNDSLVFDGYSSAFTAAGRPAVRCAGFAEDLRVFDTDEDGDPGAAPDEAPDAELDDVGAAIVLGIRDYFHKSGFRRALLGLSGGMDSALVAALAARALGAPNVLGVLMPSRFTSSASNEDARAVAKNLGIATAEVSIEGPFGAALEALGPHFGGREPDITEENLQARIRGIYLMSLSNKLGGLVLATGNKSEIAVGYATLYGDMCGAYAPLADVVKTQVYALAARENARACTALIPRRIFDKAPSAELREDQTDQDTLPPYEVLDRIIVGYVERRRSAEALVTEGLDRVVVERTLQMIKRAEYKRRQLAPCAKVTPRELGEAWRMPLAEGWKSWEA